MYIMYMTVDLNVAEARKRFSELLDLASDGPVFIARRGKRVAALVDVAAFERIVELAEDMADIRAAEETREEARRTGEQPIPLAEVMADLGLV